jgi:hypothetical protein
MAKTITCQCGAVIQGDNDDALISAAEGHIQEKHPNLVGKLSRDQLLAMATETSTEPAPSEPAPGA